MIVDATAASKLRIGCPVPATLATVTAAALKMSENAFEWHARVVAEVHADVKHIPRSPPLPCSTAAVTVHCTKPNASPDTVREAYPLCGVFNRASETTAASKL